VKHATVIRDVAAEWRDAGFDPVDASVWSKYGFDSDSALEWMAQDFGHGDVEAAAAGRDAGLDPATARARYMESFDTEPGDKPEMDGPDWYEPVAAVMPSDGTAEPEPEPEPELDEPDIEI
jgi:hypothetical protein